MHNTPNVHEASIRRTLHLPENEVQLLASAQVIADADQATKYSYRHAMVDGPGGESIQKAKENANKYVRDQIRRAQELNKAGRRCAALTHLGLAMHAVQDSTSPTHNGFQTWNGGITPESLGHVVGEFFDPGAGSQLDAATQAVMDYFTGASSLNDATDFFTYQADPAPQYDSGYEFGMP